MQTGYSDRAFGVDYTNYSSATVVRDLRMNPVIRDAWVAALESGDYVQGRNQLVSTYDGEAKHCCLGVLCELAVQAGVVHIDLQLEKFFSVLPDGNFAHYGSTLPEVVARWAGLWTEDPSVTIPYTNEVRRTLSNCNDSVGLNFTEIAEAIRTSL